MKTLATAFVDLAGWLELNSSASFDKPEDKRGVQETVQLCLAEASPEERSAIAEIALEMAHESGAAGNPQEDVRFFRAFAYWAEDIPSSGAPTIKALAGAVVELAKYIEVANFGDQDDAFGAEQRIAWCLCESSNEERAALREAAYSRAAKLREQQALPEDIGFYDRFVHQCDSQQNGG